MICIEITETSERRRIEREIWVRRNRNGVVRCHRVKAQGVCDGDQIWSLGSLEGYPGAKIIPLAQYLEAPGEQDADPELSAEEALDIIIGGTYEAE